MFEKKVRKNEKNRSDLAPQNNYCSRHKQEERHQKNNNKRERR